MKACAPPGHSPRRTARVPSRRRPSASWQRPPAARATQPHTVRPQRIPVRPRPAGRDRLMPRTDQASPAAGPRHTDRASPAAGPHRTDQASPAAGPHHTDQASAAGSACWRAPAARWGIRESSQAVATGARHRRQPDDGTGERPPSHPARQAVLPAIAAAALRPRSPLRRPPDWGCRLARDLTSCSSAAGEKPMSDWHWIPNRCIYLCPSQTAGRNCRDILTPGYISALIYLPVTRGEPCMVRARHISVPRFHMACPEVTDSQLVLA